MYNILDGINLQKYIAKKHRHTFTLRALQPKHATVIRFRFEPEDSSLSTEVEFFLDLVSDLIVLDLVEVDFA